MSKRVRGELETQSRRAGSGNLNKLDKWKFCLNAASAAVNRREHDEETTPEPRPGLQGEGGFGRYQGREDAGRRAEQFDEHPNQITTWRSQLLERAAGVFGAETKPDSSPPAIDVKTLHAKIGELTLERDFF